MTDRQNKHLFLRNDSIALLISDIMFTMCYIQKKTENELKNSGLNYQHCSILLALYEKPRHRHDLQSKLHIPRQSLFTFLKELEKGQFISQKKDTQDKRKMLVMIEPAGIKMIQSTVDFLKPYLVPALRQKGYDVVTQFQEMTKCIYEQPS